MKEFLNWQGILVAIVFGLAVWQLVRTVFKSSKGESCAGGDCKCHPEQRDVVKPS